MVCGRTKGTERFGEIGAPTRWSDIREGIQDRNKNPASQFRLGTEKQSIMHRIFMESHSRASGKRAFGVPNRIQINDSLIFESPAYDRIFTDKSSGAPLTRGLVYFLGISLSVGIAYSSLPV
jgi:hypothetical protein